MADKEVSDISKISNHIYIPTSSLSKTTITLKYWVNIFRQN